MPKVFISSTSEDLRAYRAAARDAALQVGFLPVMMEYFNAQGERVPYKGCLAKVEECDVVVAIVAHHYGWAPPDQPGRKANRTKSITWLECEKALKLKPRREVLAFLVDEVHPWPPPLMDEDKAPLREFKKWLSGLGFRGSFTNEDSLRTGVSGALNDWLRRQAAKTSPEPRASASGARKANLEKYLAWIRDRTASIDIRGLQVGTGQAHRFPIEELYIPLTTSAPGDGGKRRSQVEDLRKPVPLEEALNHPRLVIVGDPGSGKTTFLRRIAFELCRSDTSAGLALPFRAFPLLIRIADLEDHIEKCDRRHDAPTAKDSPAWLAHFLKCRSEEHQWDLDGSFFEEKLRGKATVVLLDGLDEAPSRVRRQEMARLFEEATSTYRECRFVVTTRPATYSGRSTLAGFHEVRVDELEEDAVEGFLGHWSRGLFPEDTASAEKHRGNLLNALRARTEIRRMARNPVMLTALAVVHWNERRLPEQRADLYESILTWLARAREQRQGREPADRCLELLAQLALGMQNERRGRLVQVEKGYAAEMLAPQFRETRSRNGSGGRSDFWMRKRSTAALS